MNIDGGFLLVFKKIIAILLLMSFFATSAIAQTTSNKEGSFGPRRQLATIIFAGLSGAILGLSTLSFYGRPQDRLSNIAVGFALGIFAGTIYTTYKAAARPTEFYGLEYDLELNNRMVAETYKMQNEIRITPLSYSWNF